MVKKENRAAIPEAAPGKENNQENTVAKVMNSANKNYSGMNPDSQVIALERIGKMIHDNPRAKEQFNLTDEQVTNLNEFVLTGMTTALVIDIAAKKSAWAITMSQHQFDVVKRVANDLGVTFNTKLLAAPTGDGNVSVQLNSETVNIPEDVQKAAKQEVASAEASVELDPTKFENEEDLATALNHIIVSEKGAFAKFTRTSALLRSYRLLKAGENAEEKKKIEAKSVGELLSEVFEVISTSKTINNMPIILNGFGRYIYSEVSQAMSPVLAFVKLRDASKNSAGVPSVDDDTLVGIVRTLVSYCANNSIKAEEAKIADRQKDLKVLSKDKKNNAEAIKGIEEKIATYKSNIEHFKDVIDVTHSPNSEFADDFLDDYDNPESETYRRARQAFKYITHSFYGDDFTKEANQSHIKKNVQQYIGLITNMFRSAANQFEQFSESKLIDLTAKPEDNGGSEKN
ncbi:hypothetical protein [Sharpea azabuensis]|uniref:hypothetical protein n=1 Tax=Sharpea azabuensis TaxID=322505 RepID=UPI00156A5723|nr:hypothetical protein [Sharpea azabuensis]